MWNIFHDWPRQKCELEGTFFQILAVFCSHRRGCVIDKALQWMSILLECLPGSWAEGGVGWHEGQAGGCCRTAHGAVWECWILLTWPLLPSMFWGNDGGQSEKTNAAKLWGVKSVLSSRAKQENSPLSCCPDLVQIWEETFEWVSLENKPKQPIP